MWSSKTKKRGGSKKKGFLNQNFNTATRGRGGKEKTKEGEGHQDLNHLKSTRPDHAQPGISAKPQPQDNRAWKVVKDGRGPNADGGWDDLDEQDWNKAQKNPQDPGPGTPYALRKKKPQNGRKGIRPEEGKGGGGDLEKNRPLPNPDESRPKNSTPSRPAAPPKRGGKKGKRPCAAFGRFGKPKGIQKKVKDGKSLSVAP